MQVPRFKRLVAALVCLAAVLPASGCFRITADELYSLPQASRDYLRLQEQINSVLSAGAEYSPPTSGPNRQSVQLKDLDGDGVSEAIAFFRTSGDRPLKIYVLKQSGGAYETECVIDGDGAAIESVRYADMDGDGASEIVVGWQMSAALLHMVIYSIKDGQPVPRADSDYTKITMCDLNADGHTDVLVLRLTSSEMPGEAVMFSLAEDGEASRSAAGLSGGLESVSQILKGFLSDGRPAVYVDGGLAGGKIVTDVFCWGTDGLANATLKPSAGVSADTVRAYPLNSADINTDGVIEVPSPRPIGAGKDKSYYVIDWLAYGSDGERKAIFTTYHDFSDGWYIVLPDEWKNSVVVRREDAVPGERTIVFSWLSEDGKTAEDFLKIHTLSGDNRDERARLPGRFRLLEQGDVVYAAEILPAGEELSVTKAVVAGGFKLIVYNWVTGVY